MNVVEVAFDGLRDAFIAASEWINVIDAIVVLLQAHQAQGTPAKNVIIGVAKRVCGMFGRDSLFGDRAFSLLRSAAKRHPDNAVLWRDIFQLLTDAREFATMTGQFAR